MVKRLFMETTQITVQKTSGEIIAELVKAGAVSVNTDYANGKISGLRWIMRINGSDVIFDMPARVEPVYVIFSQRKGHRTGRGGADGRLVYPALWEQAERVAWRQLLRWCQSQLAMIETGMVQAAEVFMPYIVVNAATNQTLFQRMQETQFRMLEAPKSS